MGRWSRAEQAVFVLLLAGAALRIWQYAGNPALWMDELALGHNLIARPLGLLLSTPLEDGQVAPPGYLIVVRLAVVTLGSNEYALRLFPFLCTMAALPLFGAIARQVLQPRGAVIATALFALSPGVILYAAEGKQYATDMLAALAVTVLALRWLAERTPRRALALLGAGLVAEWFSQPAILVLAAIGGILFLRARPGERSGPGWMLGIWLANGALSLLYARSRISPGLMGYMNWFWRGGLMPWPPRHASDLFWPEQVLEKIFAFLLDYPWPLLYLLIACLGAASLLVRSREAGLLLLAPLLLTLAAAMGRLYPFSVRLVLFLVPAALIFVSEGASRIA